jgi:hypothetical protein
MIAGAIGLACWHVAGGAVGLYALVMTTMHREPTPA